MEGTKFVPPIVSCSPPPLSPLSPPPLPDDSEGRPSDIGGFSFNSLNHEEIRIGQSDLNTDAIEDLDYDGFSGLDNDEYDLTGLSDKIHCIPIEAMHALPPIADDYSDKKLSNGLHSPPSIQSKTTDVNDMGKCLNQIDLNKENTKNSFESSVEAFDTNKGVTNASNAKSEDYKNGYILPLYSGLQNPEDIVLPNCNKNETDMVPDVENEVSSALSYLDNKKEGINQTQDDSVFEDFTDCDNKSLKKSVFDNGSERVCAEEFPTTQEVQHVEASAENDQLREMICSSLNTEPKVLENESFHDNDSLQISEDSCDKTQNNTDEITETIINDDNFGDFDSAFATSNEEKYDENIPSSNDAFIQDFSNDDTNKTRSEEPVFDESDDDFGDFGEIVTPPSQPVLPCSESNFVSEPVLPNTLSSTNTILISLEPNITSVIPSLFFSPSDNATSNLSCDIENTVDSDCAITNVVKALNLKDTAVGETNNNISSKRERNTNLDPVWPQICNIENTPALKLSWTGTSLKRKTFDLLNVDPDHVERDLSSKRHRRKDGVELPAYASGLANRDMGSGGTGLLEPTQIMKPIVATSSDNSSKESRSIDPVDAEDDATGVCKEKLKNGPDENSNTNILLPSKILTPKDCSSQTLDPAKSNMETNSVINNLSGNTIDWMQDELRDFEQPEEGKCQEPGISILSTKQPIAQQNSARMITTNTTSSTLASPNGLQSNSMPIDNLVCSGTNEEKHKNISSSCDIFSQIGNLVRSNEIPENEQLPCTRTNNSGHPNQNEISSQTKVNRSKEASSIISAFPLLDFMRSPILMTPLKTEKNFHASNISNHKIAKDDNFLHTMNLEHNISTSTFTTDDIGPTNCNLYTLNINGNSP